MTPTNSSARRRGGRPGAQKVEAGSNDAVDATARLARESTARILIKLSAAQRALVAAKLSALSKKGWPQRNNRSTDLISVDDAAKALGVGRREAAA